MTTYLFSLYINIMKAYRYLITVLFTDTQEEKTYRIKTTLTGVEVWFNKHFAPDTAIIKEVVYDKNQD